MKRKNIGKVFSIVLILSISFGVLSCGLIDQINKNLQETLNGLRSKAVDLKNLPNQYRIDTPDNLSTGGQAPTGGPQAPGLEGLNHVVVQQMSLPQQQPLPQQLREGASMIAKGALTFVRGILAFVESPQTSAMLEYLVVVADKIASEAGDKASAKTSELADTDKAELIDGALGRAAEFTSESDATTLAARKSFFANLPIPRGCTKIRGVIVRQILT